MGWVKVQSLTLDRMIAVPVPVARGLCLGESGTCGDTSIGCIGNGYYGCDSSSCGAHSQVQFVSVQLSPYCFR
ncbi:hypothetical protein BDW69DRAFT_160877 [Aspergillus filifer]